MPEVSVAIHIYPDAVAQCVTFAIIIIVKGGTMELVKGSYLYYHYMQNGFNDDVCASTSYKTSVCMCSC